VDLSFLTDQSVRIGAEMRPRTSEFDREAKRSAIVAAAEAVFSRQGFIRTRMADIADEAEVGKGTLYEYFSSKDELFFAVFDELHRATMETLRHDIDSGGSAREMLQRLFATGARMVRDQVEKQAVVLDFWAASRGQALEDKFHEACVASYRVYRDLTAQILDGGKESGEIRHDVDSEALAVMIVSAFDGLGVQLFFDRSLPVERTVGSLIDSLCSGICRTSS
jgi:AcrR family transcriptional regulator